MNSFDNDIKSTQTEIRANNVLLGGLLPGSTDEARRRAILGNNDQLQSEIRATKASKWAYAKSVGIAIPDALAPGQAASSGSPLPPPAGRPPLSQFLK